MKRSSSLVDYCFCLQCYSLHEFYPHITNKNKLLTTTHPPFLQPSTFELVVSPGCKMQSATWWLARDYQSQKASSARIGWRRRTVGHTRWHTAPQALLLVELSSRMIELFEASTVAMTRCHSNCEM
eukprot:1852069-Pyramimonas_sp.AAC.1